jgi:hypothetical protein
MARSYDEMQVQLWTLKEESAGLLERIAALEQKIKEMPEHQSSVLRQTLPPFLRHALCGPTAAATFPEHGALNEIKIKWKECAIKLKYKSYASLLKATLCFEKSRGVYEFNPSNDYDSSIWDTRLKIRRKKYDWANAVDFTTPLPILWERYLLVCDNNPEAALWLLIKASYYRYLNEKDGASDYIHSDLIVEADWDDCGSDSNDESEDARDEYVSPGVTAAEVREFMNSL